MKRDLIQKALAGLGRALGSGAALEIHVVGGAAGLLTRVLPAVVATADVDVVCFRPASEVERVLEAAVAVARDQGIAAGWLSIDAGLFSSAMPEGWESRRVAVRKFGRLAVYAVGRKDLIAMKF